MSTNALSTSSCGAFRELSAEETTAVSGGLGPFAFFVIMAVARCGFANAKH
ncbi:MAG TPA: hypothetical protein PKC18_08225 [Lacipirellulaceae bacterium]|nr:hypothetical protein [Lacipirellulaceae bacterium]HMP07792.1 hypothetical protein [Lacipirellulaceae bacterium]